MLAEDALSNYVPVPESGCWLWLGYTDKYGYGLFSLSGEAERARMRKAHRFFFAHASGVQLTPSIYVCHKCDTPLCVNPDHLYAGDHRTNNADAARRGRRQGERQANAILTDASVREIRSLKGLQTLSELAHRFGVRKDTICKILCGHTWKHIK